MRRRVLVLLLALAAACGGSASSPATVRVILTLGSHRLVFRAEVAADPSSRARGLMFRKSIAAGTGMYFVFPTPVRTPFYMKNTLVPLDIAWILQGRLVEIAHMQPCPGDPCPLWTPKADYDAALETPAGGLEGVDADALVEVFGAIPDPA